MLFSTKIYYWEEWHCFIFLLSCLNCLAVFVYLLFLQSICEVIHNLAFGKLTVNYERVRMKKASDILVLLRSSDLWIPAKVLRAPRSHFQNNWKTAPDGDTADLTSISGAVICLIFHLGLNILTCKMKVLDHL